MASITPEAERLARRLRMAADEIESASRYGVPIPFVVSVGSHEFSGVSFAATEEEFEAWAEYTAAEVNDYVHDGQDWSQAAVDCNGLPLQFSVRHDPAEVTA